MVHTEVVLQGNGSESLCGSFHLHVFLSFHSLVESIAPAAAFHNTTCLFVYDFHLAIENNVFIVLIEHGVSLEQLLQRVHTFALYTVVAHHIVFPVDVGLLVYYLVFLLFFELRKFCCNIRKHKQLVVVYLFSQPRCTLIGKVAGVHFLFCNEVKRLHRLWHFTVVVCHIELFRLQHTRLNAFF